MGMIYSSPWSKFCHIVADLGIHLTNQIYSGPITSINTAARRKWEKKTAGLEIIWSYLCYIIYAVPLLYCEGLIGQVSRMKEKTRRLFWRKFHTSVRLLVVRVWFIMWKMEVCFDLFRRSKLPGIKCAKYRKSFKFWPSDFFSLTLFCNM